MTAARASFRASVASVLRLAGAPRWSAPAIVGLASSPRCSKASV